jgi:hypothetical protein
VVATGNATSIKNRVDRSTNMATGLMFHFVGGFVTPGPPTNEVRGFLVDPSAVAQAARAGSYCGEESVDIRGRQIPRDSGANPNVK